jgi:hypothetical protein
MPALKNPPIACLGDIAQTGLFIAWSFNPARLPMDVVNMDDRQSRLGSQGAGQGRLSRPRLPNDHDPSHRAPQKARPEMTKAAPNGTASS